MLSDPRSAPARLLQSRAEVERLWRDHQSGREVRDGHLWLLLNFELWARQYLGSARRRMMAKVVHITTVDMSVRHLLLNQLLALRDAGFEVGAVSADGPDLGPVRAAGVRIGRCRSPAA